jgi:hypothetical protein
MNYFSLSDLKFFIIFKLLSVEASSITITSSNSLALINTDNTLLTVFSSLKIGNIAVVFIYLFPFI